MLDRLERSVKHDLTDISKPAVTLFDHAQATKFLIFLPASPLRIGAHILETFRGCLFAESFNQHPQMALVRQYCPEKKHQLVPPNQHRRKIFDVHLPEIVGLVFNIDPAESCIRELRRQPIETRPVITTDPAPFSAQANHQKLLRQRTLFGITNIWTQRHD